MERTRRDTLLGLVFFGTLAFLLWATVNLTDLSLAGVPPLVVYFPDAGSAETGTNVMVLGKKVGKVSAIDVIYQRPELPVRMTLSLREPVPLKENAIIELRDSGMLGGKQIYIDPGRGASMAETVELHGRVQKGAFDRIGDFGILAGLPKVADWRRALVSRATVQAGVAPDYPALLWEFLRARGSHLSRLMADNAQLAA